MWNQTLTQGPSVQQLATQVIQDYWIHNPMQNPPPCPVQALGAAEGCERNVLGMLFAYLQDNASRSPIRCFTYNYLAQNQFDNEEFISLLNTVLLLAGAVLEADPNIQRISQSSEIAIPAMVDSVYIRMAEKFPELQDMDTAMQHEVPRIKQMFQQMGELATRYKQSLQQPQGGWGMSQGGWPPSNGGGGGWGRSSTPSQSSRFGGNTQPAAPQWNQRSPQSRNVNVEAASLYQHSAPRPAATNSNVRSKKPMQSNSLLDLYTSQDTPPPPREPEPAPAAKPSPAPKMTDHPTGNTVHFQQGSVAVSTDKGAEQWVICEDDETPPAITPTISSEDHPFLLYERTTMKPAYCFKDGKTLMTVTERDTPMSAGYELHELAFKRRNPLLDPGDVKPMTEAFERDKLLKAETKEAIEEAIPYYQEELAGGKLCDLTLSALDALKPLIEEPNAVLVVVYEEKIAIHTDQDLKEILEPIRDASSFDSLVGSVAHLQSQRPRLAQWVNAELTKLFNQVLREDFGTLASIDDLVDDGPNIDDLVSGDFTEAMLSKVEERFLVRVRNVFGTIGYIAGGDGEMGISTLRRVHRIIDVPVTLEGLELSGGRSNSGRITRTSAPLTHRLIEGALGESADHFYWLRTADGAILEMTPAVTGKNDYLLVQRDRIGH